jgi:hypothetical protein
MCKTSAEYCLQHNSTPPPPRHTLSVYTVHLVWERGGEIREKVEGQQYTSIVLSSMGAAANSSQAGSKIPIYKSLTHNAAKFVKR